MILIFLLSMHRAFLLKASYFVIYLSEIKRKILKVERAAMFLLVVAILVYAGDLEETIVGVYALFPILSFNVLAQSSVSLRTCFAIFSK